ncbi:hypothetical protein BU23DRAFT_570416 [Bimuria novae-zelandiae CBS 107.79]|uniref:Uncharacterized protein n=1 Tax=Bimuria novae-zelandiae CBS 107.79 TaxID=1447943 RepID=A0A6A5V6W7_9PLEO|nr:hypothetical protein BU23DRAFT_570416 [Bimuria novae-zelandiae CBS 107.79]
MASEPATPSISRKKLLEEVHRRVLSGGSMMWLISHIALGDSQGGNAWVYELDNEIHPLFARDNWIMTTTASQSWYQKVATAPLKVHLSGDFCYFDADTGNEHASYDGDIPTLANILQDAKDSKAQASKEYAVQQVFAKMLDGQYHGLKFTFSEYSGSGGRFSATEEFTVMNLNSTHLSHLQKSGTQNLALILKTAFLILHELGHAFFCVGNLMDLMQPFMNRASTKTKSGQSWYLGKPQLVKGNLIFRPSARGTLMEHKHASFKSVYEDSKLGFLVKEMPDEHRFLWFATGTYIQKWFLKKTWADPGQLETLTDDTNLGKLRMKIYHPIEGWTTVFLVLPDKANIPTICWPIGNPNMFVHFSTPTTE